MTAAARPLQPDDPDAMRERRCIVSGEVLPEERLIRYVADPDGVVVPDILARLPGRGLWVSADRKVLEVAVARNHFSRAAKAPLKAPADLADRVETLLVRRIADDLGLARRAGHLTQGYDAVARALDAKKPPDLLVEAADGSLDGRRKLTSLAATRGLHPAVVDSLSCAELSLALGRENVVHAALTPGRFSERVRLEAGRLKGFRPVSGRVDN